GDEDPQGAEMIPSETSPQMPPEPVDRSGLIAWFVMHPVAANLLMLVFLLGGFLLYTHTVKEVFPSFDLDTISIRMSYPGASPEEVEQSIVLAIEDGLKDIDGLG